MLKILRGKGRCLLRQKDRRVYPIFNRHPVHRSLKVKNWVKENEARLLLVSLRSYSPEINPEELLNQDVKSHARSRQCQLNAVPIYIQGKNVRHTA